MGDNRQEMNDKELAEKVAEKLGFPKPTANVAFAEFPKNWKVFGLMVEKAGGMGWDFQCKKGLIYFMDWKTISAGFPREIKEHGHIKACALAYLEIPDE